MERLKKLSLKKRRKSSTGSSSSKSSKDQGVSVTRGRRHALIQPFSNKSEKHQIKQYQAAVEGGNASRVREILQSGLDLTEIDNDSESLRFACRNGHTETVAVLLRHGAQINQYGDYGTAAIHIAARQGNAGLLALLLSQGANVDLQTMFEKKTPLHISALHGRDNIVSLLLENNAAVDSEDIYGTTPLHLAARMGNMSTLHALIAHHPDVNRIDNDGWTALHLAADCGNLLVARLILLNHGQVDCQNKYGRTPLHWACSKGHLSMVQLLIDHKAAIGIKDLHGKTAFNYATDKNITTLLNLNYVKEDIPTEGGTIGQLITIDPRESMVRRVYGMDKNKTKTSLEGTAIPEEDEQSMISADSNSNVIWIGNHSAGQSTDVDEAFEEDTSMFETSVCNSIPNMSPDSDHPPAAPPWAKTSQPVVPAHGDLFGEHQAVDGRSPGNRSTMSTISEVTTSNTRDSVKSKTSNSSDATSSSGEFKEFGEGRDMFKSLMKALTAQNERLTKDIRFLYNDISKSLLSSDGERHVESLKSARARLELMENKMFDFHEDTEIQSEKIKGTMNDFLEKAKNKYSSTNSLDPKFYIAMFHAIGTYLSGQDGEWKKMSKGLAKGSVEFQYDMEKEINSSGDSESDKVYKCMDYLVRRNCPKGAPFLKDLLDFAIVTCGLGFEAKTRILYEFINFITAHKPSEFIY